MGCLLMHQSVFIPGCEVKQTDIMCLYVQTHISDTRVFWLAGRHWNLWSLIMVLSNWKNEMFRSSGIIIERQHQNRPIINTIRGAWLYIEPYMCVSVCGMLGIDLWLYRWIWIGHHYSRALSQKLAVLLALVVSAYFKKYHCNTSK